MSSEGSKPSEPVSTSEPRVELLDALANAGTAKKPKRYAFGKIHLICAISCYRSDDGGNDMEIYRIAGKKAVALLDPFAVPANAFLIGIKYDKGGNIDDKPYEKFTL